MKKILLTTFGVFALFAQVDLMAADHAHNWNNLVATCKSAISAAHAEKQKAKKVGFEWRDTAKLLKQAKKVGGKKCLKLANKAKNQALLAQQQAKDQANAGPPF